MAAILLYAALVSYYKAVTRFFWFDELCTVAAASQPSASAVLAGLRQAIESAPPPFSLMEHYVHQLFADEHLGYRLPSILAVLGTSLALYVFARKRAGTLGALVAAVVPLLTPLFGTFAVEARPYALEVCCLAWALVMFQRTDRLDRPWNTVALGLCLLAASSCHYYGVFAAAPFALGEAFRSWAKRRLRIGMWLAIACSGLPPLLFWPFLAELKRYYGTNYFSKPKLVSVPAIYDYVAGLDKWWGAGLGTVAIVVLLLTLLPVTARRMAPGLFLFPVEERAAILGFALLPVIVFAATKILRGGLTPWYALPAVAGIALGAAVVTAAGGRRAAGGVLALLLCVFSMQELERYLRREYRFDLPPGYPDNALLQEAVNQSGSLGLPVLVSNGIDYLSMAYYAARQGPVPFKYAVDPIGARAVAGTDTVDLTIARLQWYLPLRVESLSDFLEREPAFLLYAANRMWDWLPKRLSNGGFKLTPVAVQLESNHVLYLVKRATAAGN
jgi:hypothetical protein